MGASGWSYFVPYQGDIQKALDELRERVFQSGDYFGGRPGAKRRYATIDALLRSKAEDGTHSILDVGKISDTSKQNDVLEGVDRRTLMRKMQNLMADDPAGFMRRAAREEFLSIGLVHPLSDEQLVKTLGSLKPERRAVELAANTIGSSCSRGSGRYVVVYRDGVPDEIFFAGVSGD